MRRQVRKTGTPCLSEIFFWHISPTVGVIVVDIAVVVAVVAVTGAVDVAIVWTVSVVQVW